ncbi:hypothetical protein L1887_23941 [Cichorium endivia]|nr:hypothetical protein L1887_23941 [Cichorium endivia]
MVNVLSFLNSIILLNQLNQVVVIATGFNSCDYIYDSSLGHANQRAETLLQKLEEFVVKDEQLNKEDSVDGIGSSLLSGSLSMILCLHGSQDGPGQSQHSALLQQASYITGGVKIVYSANALKDLWKSSNRMR